MTGLQLWGRWWFIESSLINKIIFVSECPRAPLSRLLAGYGCGEDYENCTLGKLSKERSDISAIFNYDTTLLKEINKTDSLVSECVVFMPKTDGGNVRLYPTATEYAKAAYLWTRRIKNALGNHVQVGVCASMNEGEPRRQLWNEKLISTLLALESTTEPGPDALIVHQYIHEMLPEDPNNIGSPITAITDFNLMFSMIYKGINTTISTPTGIKKCLFEDELTEIQTLASGRFKIWLTEYGMDEENWKIHGSWANCNR